VHLGHVKAQARQVVTRFSCLVYFYRVRGTFVYLTTYEIPVGPNFKNDWLKHNHTNASPCHPIRRRIHASKSFGTPIIQIKVQQAISRSELQVL